MKKQSKNLIGQKGEFWMKDQEKVTRYCYFIASACSFLSGVIHLFSGETKYLSVTNFCLGASFFFLALTHKKDQKENSIEKKER